jgi:hypothetical protein
MTMPDAIRDEAEPMGDSDQRGTHAPKAVGDAACDFHAAMSERWVEEFGIGSHLPDELAAEVYELTRTFWRTLSQTRRGER